MTTRKRRSVFVAAAVVASGLGSVTPTRAETAPLGSAVANSPDARPAITLKRPPAAALGTLMVASIVVNDDSDSVTAPDGWQLVRSDAIPGAVRQAVYVKVAGEQEPARYTWTLPTARRIAGGITAYSGVDAADPVDAHDAAVPSQAVSVMPAPRLVTSVPGTRLVVLTAAASDGNLRPGSGLEKRWQASSPDAGAGAHALASAADTTQAEAGLSAPLTTVATRPGPAITAVVALRPAERRPPETAAPDPVLVGAGDIASCDSPGAEATAALVEKIPGTVFTAGDNTYTNGTAQEFARCYGPTWGRFKDRTMPAPGNHEYQLDPKATGYYEYFGAAAGDPAKGYYDYTLGSWHVIVLNSNCAEVGGCQEGSAQETWLREVLAASRADCTVAITHHARFSSALAHGSALELQPLWQRLYESGADLVISGHDHVYERFRPQRPGGAADPAFGLRQFVVGTGGRDHRNFGVPLPGSEVRNGTTFGVIKLTLRTGSYNWEFVPEAGKTFTDRGTGTCHGAPPIQPPTTTPPPSTTTPTS